MNLKQAKKLRKLVFGPTGQGKTEYESVNPARGMRVTLEAPEKYSVVNCFFRVIERVRQKAWEDIFTPAGTIRCVGPRGIYRLMKNKQGVV